MLELYRRGLIPQPKTSNPYPTPLDWLRARAKEGNPVQVLHPTKGLTPYESRDYQEDVLKAVLDRYRIIVKARQIGISQTFGLEAYWKVRFAGHPLVLCVSRNEDQAKQFVRYARAACEPGDLVRDNELELQFANGGRIKAQAASQNAGRGFPASDVYLDELAFAQWAASIYQSIEPTVSTGGTLTVFSSPKGRANLFYQLWAGQFGDEDWKRFSFSWRVLWDEEWAEKKRRTMTREGFAEEYEAEDGFLQTGGILLDAEDVEACFTEGCEQPGPRPGRMYRLYCDPAGSGADATVLQVWDVTARPYVLVRQERWITGKFRKLYDRAEALARLYGCDKMRVDRTGLGEPIVEELEERLSKADCAVEPFLFTKASKEAGLTAVKMLFEDRAVRFSDPQLKAEALTYQVDDDELVTDCLMTLLLMASQLREERGDEIVDVSYLLDEEEDGEY